MTAAVLCTEETAACLIPHLISELETPCPCRRHDGLYLTGTSIDGRQVSITVKKGVLEVEGIGQEELDALAERRCLLRTASRRTHRHKQGQRPCEPYHVGQQ